MPTALLTILIGFINLKEKLIPSDVSDAEWALVVPYLTLMTEVAPQRDYPLREVFNGLRWMGRCGSSWRMMPHDLPPRYVVYQQTRRWFKAKVNEASAGCLAFGVWLVITSDCLRLWPGYTI